MKKEANGGPVDDIENNLLGHGRVNVPCHLGGPSPL